MSEIFFTSDPHLGHDKDFVYKARGFNSIQEHDEAIIRNWNEIVGPDDTVYVAGDITMGADHESNIAKLSKLNGHIIVIRGNHDTNRKFEEYLGCKNIRAVAENVMWSHLINVGKWSFLLSHWPTMVGDAMHSKHSHRFFCLHGHTHSKDKFQFFEHGCYNVAMDAHGNKPVNVKEIQNDIKIKLEEMRRENAATE
jgi:calcineurin-like phosphoesterase family protein